MHRLLNITESPLNSKSIMAVLEAPTDPLDGIESEDESVSVHWDATPVSSEHAAKSLEYYGLPRDRRNPSMFVSGPEHIQKTMRHKYDEIINDSSWSADALRLFKALQYGTPVSYTPLKKKGSCIVDIGRKKNPITVGRAQCVVVEVRANARYYWENEKELFEYSKTHNIGVTTADPGTLRAYETRIFDAAHHEVLCDIEVKVRKLENGKCVEENIRPIQKFIIDSGPQKQFVQNMYEMFVWHWTIQSEWIEEWRDAEDQFAVASAFAKKLNLHLETNDELLKIVDKIVDSSIGEKTATIARAVSMEPVEPSLEVVLEKEKKKKKNPTSFEKYYQEHKSSTTTKIALQQIWRDMGEDEKKKYSDDTDTKKRKVQETTDIQTVATNVSLHTPEKNITDELQVYFDTCGDEGKKFVWNLYAENMRKARKLNAPSFSKTPFEVAQQRALRDGDIGAMQQLKTVPGIATSFQMFNLLFSDLFCEAVTEEEELVFS